VTFGGSVRFLIVWFSWDAVMVSIAVLNEGNSDISFLVVVDRRIESKRQIPSARAKRKGLAPSLATLCTVLPVPRQKAHATAACDQRLCYCPFWPASRGQSFGKSEPRSRLDPQPSCIVLLGVCEAISED
jgi:hypothetical protein